MGGKNKNLNYKNATIDVKVVIRDNDAYFNETERPRVNQVWSGVAVIDRRNVG